MNKNKEPLLAFGLMAALFLIGTVCFAAFPPGKPIRVLLDFNGGAGKVLFEHEEHAADFDLSCLDCHHTAEDETDKMQNCSACHLAKPAEGSDTPSRKDALHAQCIGCHEEMGLELECNDCHSN